MANKNGLRLLGFAYAVLTLTVAAVAVLVVTTQINSAVQARPTTLASEATALR